MKYLLYIPAFLYLVLILINLKIFNLSTEINFFWMTSLTMPVVVFVSLFFLVYIVLIWMGLNLSNRFTGYRNEKLEKEVVDLKGKLLDKQWELIKNIESHFAGTLEVFKTEADKKLELYKKETEKVVSNMQYDFETLGKKIDNIK